jgi:hypothetical protein
VVTTSGASAGSRPAMRATTLRPSPGARRSVANTVTVRRAAAACSRAACALEGTCSTGRSIGGCAGALIGARPGSPPRVTTTSAR